MSETFANLKLNRIIVHEVLLASDLDAGKEPQQSDLLLELDTKGETLICKRLTDSMGSASHSVEVTVNVDQENSAFDLITKLLDVKEKEFLRITKELALQLSRAQSAGTIKPGICVVLEGTMGSNASPSRFVAVLKAESDAGFVKQKTKKAVLLKYINEMVLGAQQRLYKIGCFIEKQRPADGHADGVRSKADFEAIVYDHQMSNTGDNNAARYFYSAFLGCRLAENAQRLTKIFYTATSEHIDAAKLPAAKRVEFKNHLVSYLKSQEAQVSPRTFAERFLPSEMQADYLERLKRAGFPPRDVMKDNKLIKHRLQVRRMLFSSKVRISGPGDSFPELVKIMGSKDGWTTVQISGELENQT